MKPPGKVHSPCPGSNPLRSRRMSPSGVNGMAAATGLGLKKRTNPHAAQRIERGGSFVGVAPQRRQCSASSSAGFRLATVRTLSRGVAGWPRASPCVSSPGLGPLTGGCPTPESSKEVLMTSPQVVRTPAVPGPADIEPAVHENLHRTLTGLVSVVPVLALGVAAWQSWEGLLRPRDLLIFGVLYVLTGFGVTVGFHRLFTHRSFKTVPVLRGVLAILGSAAIEGPVISWVADHRKHHAFSDAPRRPAQPARRSRLRLARHAARAGPRPHGLAVRARPAWRARPLRTRPARRSGHAVRRPLVLRVGRRRDGRRVRAGLRCIGGTWQAALTALLWGGAVRLLLLHHVTFSINSICHVFGRKSLPDDRRVPQRLLALADHVRRVLAQQPPRVPDVRAPRPRTVGDRPVSAGHPRARALGLAWDVVSVDPERQSPQAVRRRRGLAG